MGGNLVRGWGAVGGGALALVAVLAVSFHRASADPRDQREPAALWAQQRERARPADAAALFSVFAASPGFEAEYVEEKRLVLLAAPLEARGRMYFLPPGYLLRRVTHPEASSVSIAPSRMRIVQRGQERVVDFATAPELGRFARSLALVFAGDAAGLAQHFSVAYAALPDSARGWRLELRPRGDVEGNEALARIVERVVLEGEGEAVLSIEVTEGSGDVTRTRIVAADPARVFSAEERAQLFGPTAPGAASAAARAGES